VIIGCVSQVNDRSAGVGRFGWLAAGADLINETCGGWDHRLAKAAEQGAGLVCSCAGGLAARTRPHRVASPDFPVLVSVSHKEFIGETLDAVRDQRLTGTVATTAVRAWLGALVFRAHQVIATREVLDMVAAIRGDQPSVRAVRALPNTRHQER
jgi:dihydropteroate synthase